MIDNCAVKYQYLGCRFLLIKGYVIRAMTEDSIMQFQITKNCLISYHHMHTAMVWLRHL